MTFLEKKCGQRVPPSFKILFAVKKTSPFRFLSTRKTDREKNSIFPERKIIQFFSQNLDFLMFQIKMKAVFESLGYLLSIFGTVNLIKFFQIVSCRIFKCCSFWGAPPWTDLDCFIWRIKNKTRLLLVVFPCCFFSIRSKGSNVICEDLPTGKRYF